MAKGRRGATVAENHRPFSGKPVENRCVRRVALDSPFADDQRVDRRQIRLAEVEDGELVRRRDVRTGKPRVGEAGRPPARRSPREPARAHTTSRGRTRQTPRSASAARATPSAGSRAIRSALQARARVRLELGRAGREEVATAVRLAHEVDVVDLRRMRRRLHRRQARVRDRRRRQPRLDATCCTASPSGDAPS